jgi:hypothetical protein
MNIKGRGGGIFLTLAAVASTTTLLPNSKFWPSIATVPPVVDISRGESECRGSRRGEQSLMEVTDYLPTRPWYYHKPFCAMKRAFGKVWWLNKGS